MDTKNLPFSLFDLFALIFPGAVGVFAIYLLFYNQIGSIQIAQIDITSSILFLIASYLFGHVLHAASEILIDRVSNLMFGSIVGQYLETVGLAERRQRRAIPAFLSAIPGVIKVDWNPDILYEWRSAKDQKQTKEKDINAGKLIEHCLSVEFGIIPQKINHIFQFVLAYSQKNTRGETNEVPIFAAVETMFRSLALATIILFLGFRNALSSVKNGPQLEVLANIVLLILIGLFLYSYRRYKRMWVETIFAQFVVASSQKHTHSQE